VALHFTTLVPLLHVAEKANIYQNSFTAKKVLWEFKVIGKLKNG
jgi:hypothetical protein